MSAPVPQVAVTGRTRLYGILADPIHHVKTPQVMHALFAREGVDGVLVPFHVRPDGLARAVDGLRAVANFGGFIATVPHKTLMPALCDQLTEAARLVGAVNCVRRNEDGTMAGAMLDGIGFVEGLRGAGHDPSGMTVHLAGAGGAASAIAVALAEAGVSAITVANRTAARAEELAARIRTAFPKVSVAVNTPLAGADLVVNATALGMREGDALPVDASALTGREIVAEAIMEPARTPLLQRAEAAGCRIHPGLPMLESQIRLMAEHMGALEEGALEEGGPEQSALDEGAVEQSALGRRAL